MKISRETKIYALNKRAHIHTIVLYKTILIYTHHHDNPTIVFSLLTRNTRHHSFLILHIALKILTSTVSSATTNQLPKYIYILSLHEDFQR